MFCSKISCKRCVNFSWPRFPPPHTFHFHFECKQIIVWIPGNSTEVDRSDFTVQITLIWRFFQVFYFRRKNRCSLFFVLNFHFCLALLYLLFWFCLTQFYAFFNQLTQQRRSTLSKGKLISRLLHPGGFSFDLTVLFDILF